MCFAEPIKNHFPFSRLAQLDRVAPLFGKGNPTQKACEKSQFFDKKCSLWAVDDMEN
jgi:hypothetical protein